MDNPDPKHFRLFFCQAMVDTVLRQSKTSNCLENGEKFLVSLGAMGTTGRSLLPARHPTAGTTSGW